MYLLACVTNSLVLIHVTVHRWRELHIAAGYSNSGKFTDEEVMMAAGMLEGYLSQL